jgi:F1F0 ATPase subunit 2
VTDPWLALALGLVAGAGLGAVHFGALWWTVRRLPRLRRPGGWLALSVAVRFVVVLAGFVVLVRVHPLALLAALVGFLVARFAATRWLGGVAEAAAGDAETEGGTR